MLLNSEGFTTNIWPEASWENSVIPSDAIDITFNSHSALEYAIVFQKWNGNEFVDYEPSEYRGYDRDEKEREYFLSLGKFIDRFTRVENHIMTILNLTVGLPNDVGWVAFERLSMDRVKQIINKVFAFRGEKKSIYMDRAFGQFDKIRKIRNTIAHNFVSFDKNGDMTIGSYNITAEMLDNMTDDLKNISLYLVAHTLSINSPHSRDLIDEIALHADRPWRYNT